MGRSLLQRVAAGEAGTVTACLDEYGDLVWSLARRLAPGEAEDAVQEIFIDVWKSAGRYDPAIASEATFVAMIARRRLIDRRRSRRPEPSPLVEGAVTTPDRSSDALGVSDEAVAAARALEALSTEQQRVITMAVYHGLSHDQISNATGLPLGTVKTHMRRGLIRVRELLARAADGVRTGVGA